MPKGGTDNSMLRYDRKCEGTQRNAFLSSTSSIAANKRSDDWKTQNPDDQRTTIGGIGTGAFVLPQKPSGFQTQMQRGSNNPEGRWQYSNLLGNVQNYSEMLSSAAFPRPLRTSVPTIGQRTVRTIEGIQSRELRLAFWFCRRSSAEPRNADGRMSNGGTDNSVLRHARGR